MVTVYEMEDTTCRHKACVLAKFPYTFPSFAFCFTAFFFDVHIDSFPS